MKTLVASTVRKCQCPWRKMTIQSVKLARPECGIPPLDIMYSTCTYTVCGHRREFKWARPPYEHTVPSETVKEKKIVTQLQKSRLGPRQH